MQGVLDLVDDDNDDIDDAEVEADDVEAEADDVEVEADDVEVEAEGADEFIVVPATSDPSMMEKLAAVVASR